MQIQKNHGIPEKRLRDIKSRLGSHGDAEAARSDARDVDLYSNKVEFAACAGSLRLRPRRASCSGYVRILVKLQEKTAIGESRQIPPRTFAAIHAVKSRLW